MRIKNKFFLVVLLISLKAFSEICPDPKTSTLSHGEIPWPWLENPFSPHLPVPNLDMYFASANILVSGLGIGVVCTYRHAEGSYSIWQARRVRIPGNLDVNWIQTVGGYVCVRSLIDCAFETI